MNEPKRITVEQYHGLIDAGYFARDDRFELLDGWIVARPVCTPRHASHIEHLRAVLDKRLPEAWHIRTRSGFTLKRSEPEPDLLVVAGEPLDYVARHPGVDDAALVIEAADVNPERDHTLRRRIYAEEGIRLYWLLNLDRRAVEVYSDPSGPAPEPAFGVRSDFAGADVLTLPVGRHSIQIAVNEIFFT